MKKAAKRQSSLQAPIQQSGATNPQPGDCAAAIAPHQTFAQETTSTASTIASNSLTKGKMEVVVKITEFPDDIKRGLDQRKSAMPTQGKLELTIKINEFPANVQTLDNGSKQFDIDTGEQIVTVTLKPKVFKKLEQAQENYPMWVAAIAGQMGEKTESGFILKEPNVQTFEKKPKEPKEGATPVANGAM